MYVKAHLSINLRKSFDIFPQEWHVTKFVVDHNHDLFSPSEVWFLPANRVITIDDEKCIFLLKEARLSIREEMYHFAKVIWYFSLRMACH